jgi:hypothetical protein
MICVVGFQPEVGSYVCYLLFSLVLLVVFGGMGLSWMECKKSLNKVCQPSNITSKIVERLKNYLKSVSDQNLIWRIGVDFYWIEIEKINLHKK